MDIRQMHIRFNQGLQAIASNKSRKFLPDEIDEIFNINILRFIKSRVLFKPALGGGFEVDMDKLRAIEPLVNNEALQVESTIFHRTASPRGKQYIESPLPKDCLYPIKVSSSIEYTCKGTSPLVNPQIPVAVWALQMPQSTLSSGPYYTNVSIKDGATTIYSLQTTFPGASWPAKTDYFYVRDLLIENTPNWLRLESYIDNQKNNYMIITSRAPGGITFTETPTISIDGIDTPFALIDTIPFKSYKTAVGDVSYKPARLFPHDDLPLMSTLPYYKSTSFSPMAHIQKGNLIVEGGDDFIIRDAYLTYVRKPRIISLKLNQTSDINPEQIIDLSIEYVKQKIADPTYRTAVQDNMLRGDLQG